MIRRLLRALLPLASLLLCGISAKAQSAHPPRAARLLARGVTITAADIVADSSCTAICVSPGWVTRKVIAAGEPLTSPAVASPPIIFAGDSVRVEHHVGGVALSTRAVAATTAARNEQLTIALMSGARITALAISPGLVRLP